METDMLRFDLLKVVCILNLIIIHKLVLGLLSYDITKYNL